MLLIYICGTTTATIAIVVIEVVSVKFTVELPSHFQIVVGLLAVVVLGVCKPSIIPDLHLLWR